jgi:hypothetical protein
MASKRVDPIHALLDAGAVMDDKSGPWPNMCFAAACSSVEVLRLLLSHKLDIEVRDPFGRTPLFQAAWHGEPAVVDFLLAQGADVNASDQYGQTPLSAAVKCGREEVVEVLLRNPVTSLSSGDIWGQTMEECAAATGNLSLLEHIQNDTGTKDVTMAEITTNSGPNQWGQAMRCDICCRYTGEGWFVCNACKPVTGEDIRICAYCRARGFVCLNASHTADEAEWVVFPEDLKMPELPRSISLSSSGDDEP